MATGLAEPGGASGGLAPSEIEIAKTPRTRTAMALARSDRQNDQEKLRALLTDEAYLKRLNTPDEYLRLPPRYLQLNFILETLCANPHERALATLDLLAGGSSVYSDAGPRRALLLMASGRIHTAPPGIRRLWDSQLRPDADELDLTVRMLAANGSQTAMNALADALLHQDYEPDYVISWLREPILTHRQDPLLLAACERLLQTEAWPDGYKSVLVEVLFDYHPELWYLMETRPPQPPDRKTLSGAARKTLLEIADLARRQGRLTKRRHAEILRELNPE